MKHCGHPISRNNLEIADGDSSKLMSVIKAHNLPPQKSAYMGGTNHQTCGGFLLFYQHSASGHPFVHPGCHQN